MEIPRTASAVSDEDIRRWKELGHRLGIDQIPQFVPYQFALLVEIRDCLNRIETLLAEGQKRSEGRPRQSDVAP